MDAENIMQILKSLVIGLGVLIFAGFGLLAYGFYHKARDPGWRMFSTAAPGGRAAGPSAPFGTVGLELPAGCTIDDVSPDGERAYLTIGPEDGPCARIVVFDVVAGRVLGVIKPGR
jgi:hypothetical protein